MKIKLYKGFINSKFIGFGKEKRNGDKGEFYNLPEGFFIKNNHIYDLNKNEYRIITHNNKPALVSFEEKNTIDNPIILQKT